MKTSGLRFRLRISSFFIIMLIVVMLIFGITQFINSRNIASEIIPLSNLLSDILQIKNEVEDIETSLDDFFVTGSTFRYNQIVKNLNLLNELSIEHQTASEWKALRKQWNSIVVSLSEKIDDLYHRNIRDSREKNEAVSSMYEMIRLLKQINTTMTDVYLNSFQKRFRDQEKSLQVAMISFSIFSLLYLVVYLVLGYRMDYQLMESLVNLNQVTSSISMGDYKVRVIKKTNDELGDLADNFNNMTEVLESTISRLTDSIRQKDILMEEIHHRVKNNLQVVASILHLEYLNTDNEDIRDHLSNTVLRINSIGILHQQLYRDKNIGEINLYEYFSNIIENAWTIYKEKNEKVRIKISTNNLRMNINQAISCGMIINEAITNSFKYAFEKAIDPEIGVEISLDDMKYLLIIFDNGAGMPGDVGFGCKSGVGLQIIDVLAIQLNGKAKIINDNGTRYELTFKKSEKENSNV